MSQNTQKRPQPWAATLRNMISSICMLKQTSIHFFIDMTQNRKKLKKKIDYYDFLCSFTLTSCVILRHLASFKLILDLRYEFYIKNYVTFDFERRFLPRKNALLQGFQRSLLKIHEKNECEDHDILMCGAIEDGRIFLSGIFLRKVFRPSEDTSRSY